MRPHPRPVHSISTAPRSAEEDLRARTRAYLIMMTIRTVSFIGMGVAAIGGVTWLALVLAVAAVLLPYPAVIIANATDRRTIVPPPEPVTRHVLTAGGSPGPSGTAGPAA